MQICTCGKKESHWTHTEVIEPGAYTGGHSDPERDCDYDVDYQGEETGYVWTCLHHEFEKAT